MRTKQPGLEDYSLKEMDTFTYNDKRDIKILIVDHHDSVLNGIHMILYDMGFHVITAKNAISALSRFEINRPQMVFLEIDLPAITGFVALRKMKSYIQGMNHNTRIIMLTERNTKEDFKRSIEYGADDYIIKPVTKEKLVEKIQRHLFHL